MYFTNTWKDYKLLLISTIYYSIVIIFTFIYIKLLLDNPLLFSIVFLFITIMVGYILIKRMDIDIEIRKNLFELIEKNPKIKLDDLITKSKIKPNRVLSIIKDFYFFRDIGIIIYPLYEGEDENNGESE